MPRPGPRPYECVRRAWHSDRHQPIRGSIIQQIFRLVNQSHSSATRKNREWQEKLPIVVFKAEEIMYSKANSEAEYMDSETLWDRLNEAIDTIIRKEEGMESEGFLQPCIEAALVLGCIPVRGSRSQRNNNPRSYLTHSGGVQPPPPPPPQEAPPPDKSSIDKRFIPHPSSSVPPTINHQLCSKSPRSAHLTTTIPNLDNHHVPHNNTINIPICNNNQFPILRPSFDSNASHPIGGSNQSSSVYPLYHHGLHSHQQPLESSQTHYQWPQLQKQQLDPSSNVIYGRPVASLSLRPNNNFESPSRNVFHHRETTDNSSAAALYHMQRRDNPIEPGEDASPRRNVFHHREIGGSSPAAVALYHMQRRANLIECGLDVSPSRSVFHPMEIGENSPAALYHMQRQANPVEPGEDALCHMQRRASPIEPGGEDDASPMDCDLSLRLGISSSGG